MNKAKTVHLGKGDGHVLFFSWVGEKDSIYHSVELNIDQVVLLLKQAAEIVSGCIIAERV